MDNIKMITTKYQTISDAELNLIQLIDSELMTLSLDSKIIMLVTSSAQPEFSLELHLSAYPIYQCPRIYHAAVWLIQ